MNIKWFAGPRPALGMSYCDLTWGCDFGSYLMERIDYVLYVLYPGCYCCGGAFDGCFVRCLNRGIGCVCGIVNSVGCDCV